MNRIYAALAALLVVIAAAIVLNSPATAAPTAKPTPPPAYTLGQEIVVVEGASLVDSYTTVRAECPAGKVVSGGGHYAQHVVENIGGTSQPFPAASYPDTPSSWTVLFSHDGLNQRAPLRVYAVCVNP